MGHNDEHVFENGASVEVSPDDIGLSGSWYEATVVSPVPPETNPRSNTKNKKRKRPSSVSYYDVEYKALLEDDDETRLLTERVRSDHIRPLPPPYPPQSGHRFRLDDVVEAFYRDGWWVGVVTEVLQDSGHFQVTFTNPPDQIEFTASDLRVHLEWIDGAWVQPEAQPDSELDVKVQCFKIKRGRPNKELAGDDVNKCRSRSVNRNPLFRKCKLLESYDQSKMRPSKKQRSTIVVSSSADGYEDPTKGERNEGSKETSNNITKEDGIPAGNQQNSTNMRSDNRPQSASARSVDSSDSANREKDKEVSKEAFRNRTDEIGVDAGKSTSDAHSHSRSMHSAPCDYDSGRYLNRNVRDVIDSVNKSGSMGRETLDQAVYTAKAITGNGSTFINRYQEMEVVKEPAVVELYGYKFINQSGEMEIVNEAAPVEGNGSNLGQELEDTEQAAVIDGNGNEFINPSQERDNADQAAGAKGDKNEILNFMLEPNIVDQPAAVEGNDNEFINPMQEMETATVERNVSDVINCNQELAVVAKHVVAVDSIGSKFINPSQELELVVGRPSVAVERNLVDPEDLNFPFAKTLALWNIIESMQIFQAFPQRPHFRRLVDKYPECCREGKALGYMLMFRDIVEKTVNLQLDDGRESITELLRILPKLEKNGFEVMGICNFLTTLLVRKDEHSRIRDQLVEQNQKKAMVVETIEELNMRIKEMQEKCAEAMSSREKIECEIADIESHLAGVRQSFEENVFEFERLATASW